MKILLVIILASLTTFAQTTTADRVGINTATPSVPLEIKVRYPADTTASEELIRFVTPTGTHNGVTHHPFQFYQRSTVFGDDRTDSVGWGFTPAGDVQAAPSLAFVMEDSFGNEPTTPENFELHLQLAATEGGVSRPWTWTFDRRTGKTVLITSAEYHIYGGGWLVSGKPELHITPAETLSLGPLRQQSDSVSFETTANGGAPMKQIRILPHLNDAGLSRLTFGDAGGVGLANVGNELQVQRNGNPSTITAGAYKAYGVKVVGAQCAAIANSNGTQTDDTRAINAILGCLRSHGLVAP